ncbi:hypothetical protein L1887_48883 [Cichorium endivia]|nr:hypothetical protein L1887_48883 [Cichorium endivia]
MLAIDANAVRSENPAGELLGVLVPRLLGGNIAVDDVCGPFKVRDQATARVEIDVFQGDTALCSEKENERAECDDDVGGLSWVEEGGVSLEEHEHEVEHERDPSSVGREPCTEGELVERASLAMPCGAEADVAEANDGKDDEGADTGDRDERDKVGEHERRDGDLALGRGPSEDLGCPASSTERLQGSGGDVKRRVARRDDREDDKRVDQARSRSDAAVLERDGEWGGGSLALGADELRVVGRHVERDEEDRSEVQHQDAVEDGANGQRHGSGGILGLGCGDADTLDTGVEGSRNDEDLGNTVEGVDAGAVERAGIPEVAEADVALVAACAADVDDDAEDEEDDDADDLDGGEDELDFAVCQNAEHREAHEEDPEDGDPCAGGDDTCAVPVADDDGDGVVFIGEHRDPQLPVDPACDESERGVDPAASVLDEGAADGKERRHLSERLQDEINDGTRDGECNERANRAGIGECRA